MDEVSVWSLKIFILFQCLHFVHCKSDCEDIPNGIKFSENPAYIGDAVSVNFSVIKGEQRLARCIISHNGTDFSGGSGNRRMIDKVNASHSGLYSVKCLTKTMCRRAKDWLRVWKGRGPARSYVAAPGEEKRITWPLENLSGMLERTWFFIRSAGSEAEPIAHISKGHNFTISKSTLTGVSIEEPATMLLKNVNIGHNGSYRLECQRYPCMGDFGFNLVTLFVVASTTKPPPTPTKPSPTPTTTMKASTSTVPASTTKPLPTPTKPTPTTTIKTSTVPAVSSTVNFTDPTTPIWSSTFTTWAICVTAAVIGLILPLVCLLRRYKKK